MATLYAPEFFGYPFLKYFIVIFKFKIILLLLSICHSVCFLSCVPWIVSRGYTAALGSQSSPATMESGDALTFLALHSAL